MKKISKSIWNLYKESVAGQELITQFQKAASKECSGSDMLSLAKKCNPRYFTNRGEKFDVTEINFYESFRNIFGKILSEEEKELICSSIDEKYGFYQWNLMNRVVGFDHEEYFEDLPQNIFKDELWFSITISWSLYSIMPSCFIPNFFAFQFNYLVRFAHMYEIDLPDIPNRSSYKDRCMYYMELNEILWEYAKLNDITEPAEVCAFWFGLALPLAKESIEEERVELPEIPEQAWLLVGNYHENEKHMTAGFWQANPMTTRGDILMFYEKSPVKKMNSMWIALDDGVADPFFHYYGYTFIGHKIEIPDEQALTYQDFKSSEYFKVENRGKEGNYVSKNFQDCSGWPIPFEDYAEIRRMLKDKGFDTSVMPSLYEPKGITTEDINDEEDVYKKLITPLLEEMGWTLGKDFKREVEFAAGHSTTGHQMNKRPDYCLHITEHGKKIYAKVIIEAKYFIKNNTELADTFDQCLTYACWGKAQVLVLCDKNTIYVYEQNRNGEFDQHHHRTRYRWSQMNDPEIFKELKRKLDI